VHSTNINTNTKWKQHGVTIVGINGVGGELNQLYWPEGIYVDDDHRCIYIADYLNHRIVQWKWGAKNGQVVAGGNGKGDRMDQLNYPTNVILDKNNDLIIISDFGNKRVIQWPCQNGTSGQIIISDIDCWGITMDNNGNLYVSDYKKNEVRRWKVGDEKGTIVAGGHGKGNDLNQLNWPVYLFVDEDHSVYVSDYFNHRVVKWMKNAKEGIVIAGGQGEGNSLTQLSRPSGVIVDHMGHVYVADSWNDRIMRWLPGSSEGSIVIGGNGKGKKPNHFNNIRGLSFDRQGNLYVVDKDNNRVQKFDIISS